MASVPSIQDAIVFRVKATGLQLRRLILNRSKRWIVQSDFTQALTNPHLLAESITPLWTPHEASERNLIEGKIENLRVAVRRIHGVEIPIGEVFSFWANVGRPTRSNGYVIGRELRQGCVIPSVGGGICQLSNALYSVALDAGFEIVERHGHSQIMPGSLAEIGRDATVFWNYIDLRFRLRSRDTTIGSVRFDATLTEDALVVRLWGIPIISNPVISNPVISNSIVSRRDSAEIAEDDRLLVPPHTCQTCNVSNCFRNQPTVQSNGKVTAYLLDEYWAEFDRWIQSQAHQSTDLLAIPIDGKRWKKPNYAWTMTGFKTVKQARLQTIKRSLSSRKIPAQGGARQNQLFNHDEALAKVYAQQLSPEINHVVVTQTLLPFLWRDGVLGGRSFEVLMTRLPIAVLQHRLDRASGLHPESSTLKDFRADEALLKLEQAALKAAQRIITPHAEIANCFPHKSLLLNWELPPVQPRSAALPTQTILFPASTLGRKGAYELRSVAQALNLTVRILGRELEGDDFWQNEAGAVTIDRTFTDPFANIFAIVLPAHVENHPKMLLKAIGLGIPVIATEACGLHGLTGVTIVKAGDEEGLRLVLKALKRRYS